MQLGSGRDQGISETETVAFQVVPAKFPRKSGRFGCDGQDGKKIDKLV